MASSSRANRQTKSSKQQRALLEDIKENCPLLKNINLSEVRGMSLQEQVLYVASMIPVTQKPSDLHKLCHQQERRILTNLQKNHGYSLYKEIEKVNPALKKELVESHHNELSGKLKHYQSMSSFQMEVETSSSEPVYEEIFKDELMDVDLAYLFEKHPQNQQLTSNMYNIRMNEQPQYKPKDFNQVHNLMEELDSHTSKINSENHDFNEILIKKYFDLN